MQPGCSPPLVVTQDGDLQLLDGERQTGLRSWSHPQLKDVHHPRWGGGLAEPALYLPRGFAGHPLPRRSRERALTGPAGDPDFDNAGLVDGGRRHLQCVGLVGLAPGGPFCRRAAAAQCARVDRSRCRAPLGRRSCSGVVLPLHRRGIFTRRPVPHSSGRI
jgi:hypothetical protein